MKSSFSIVNKLKILTEKESAMIAPANPNSDLELDTAGVSLATQDSQEPSLGEPANEIERLSIELARATIERVDAERIAILLRHRETELADRIKTLIEAMPDPAAKAEADAVAAVLAEKPVILPKSGSTEVEIVEHALNSLDIADGWIKKLNAAGVYSVEGLHKFIAAGKLVPGALPRVGPEAVGKIKAACDAFAKERGWPAIATVSTESPKSASPTQQSEPITPVPVAQKTLEETRAKGAEMARNGFGTEHNPWKYGTPSWQAWDAGWQENYDPSKFPEFQDDATKGESTPHSPEPVARETSNRHEFTEVPKLAMNCEQNAQQQSDLDDDLAGL